MSKVKQEKNTADATDKSPRPALPHRPQPRFRAWDKAKGEWVEGGYGFHILGEAMLLGGLFHGYGVMELNNIVITQFTGILDKDGKDVYEGDILKHEYDGGEHVVAWLEDSTGFFVGERLWPLTKLCTPRITVVGNVFGTLNEPERDAETSTVGVSVRN